MMKYVCLIVATFVVASATYRDLGYYRQLGINDKCEACICEGISGCNIATHCEGDICGPFRITWGYWKDAGALTVRGEPPSDSAAAYMRCAIDPWCAASTVHNYLLKFRQDCNGDGVIDCQDFARIHVLGGYGCHGNLPEPFSTRFHQCLLN